MATGSTTNDQLITLDSISWSTYEAILRETSGRKRMAYNEGMLEIMSPSRRHENASCLIGRMIETFTEVMEIDMESVNSLTCKRENLAKGFESNEAYYIQSYEAVRDKGELDFTVDPPPDLVVEIDISCSSMNKFSIYGPIGVPEVWRFDGKTGTLTLDVRRQDGGYDEVESSTVLPQMPIALVRETLAQLGTAQRNKTRPRFPRTSRENQGCRQLSLQHQ